MNRPVRHNVSSPWRRAVELEEENRSLRGRLRDFENGTTVGSLEDQIQRLTQLIEHQNKIVLERNRLAEEKKMAIRDLELLKAEHSKVIRKKVAEMRTLKADHAEAVAIREVAAQMEATMVADRTRIEKLEKMIHRLETRLRREAEIAAAAREREEKAHSMHQGYVALHETERLEVIKAATSLSRVATVLASQSEHVKEDVEVSTIKRRYSFSVFGEKCSHCGCDVQPKLRPLSWRNDTDSVGEDEKNTTALRYLGDRAKVVAETIAGNTGTAARRLAIDELHDALDVLEGGWLGGLPAWESDMDSILKPKGPTLTGMPEDYLDLYSETTESESPPVPAIEPRAATSIGMYTKATAKNRIPRPPRSQAMASAVLSELRPWGSQAETQEKPRRANGTLRRNLMRSPDPRVQNVQM